MTSALYFNHHVGACRYVLRCTVHDVVLRGTEETSAHVKRFDGCKLERRCEAGPKETKSAKA